MGAHSMLFLCVLFSVFVCLLACLFFNNRMNLIDSSTKVYAIKIFKNGPRAITCKIFRLFVMTRSKFWSWGPISGMQTACQATRHWVENHLLPLQARHPPICDIIQHRQFLNNFVRIIHRPNSFKTAPVMFQFCAKTWNLPLTSTSSFL